MATNTKRDEINTQIFTTEIVENIINKENKGFQLKRNEKIWLKNISGVRKPSIKFAMTLMEREEYMKCKLSVQYFAENYCHIKREDGSIGQMKLRDYQKEIIDLYTKYDRSILIASRQVGKTVSASIVLLHFCLFNDDKNVMIVANKGTTVIEILDKIKKIYMLLPFFLKMGVLKWNEKGLTFDNGCSIKTEKRTKEPAIGFTIDLLYSMVVLYY